MPNFLINFRVYTRMTAGQTSHENVTALIDAPTHAEAVAIGMAALGKPTTERISVHGGGPHSGPLPKGAVVLAAPKPVGRPRDDSEIADDVRDETMKLQLNPTRKGAR